MTRSRRHTVVQPWEVAQLPSGYSTIVCSECRKLILCASPASMSRRGSSAWTFVALAAFWGVVGLTAGWALWEWAVR